MCTATLKLEFINKVSESTDIDRKQLEETYDIGFLSAQSQTSAIIAGKFAVFNLIEKYSDQPVRRRRNPVAKNINTFNKPATHLDRKKAMKRGKRKHITAYEDENVPQGMVDAIVARAKKHDYDISFLLRQADKLLHSGRPNAGNAWRKAALVIQDNKKRDTSMEMDY